MPNTRRSFRRNTPRRSTTWEGFSLRFQVTAALPQFSIVTTEAILENYPNPTLVRQRGRILAYLQAGGATLDSVLTLGMYFATAQAAAAGIGSLAKPFDNIGSDWLWWDSIALSDNSGTIDQIRPTTSAHRIDIDGKGMRKVEQNHVLVFVAQIFDFGATLANASVTAEARLLYKK